MNTATLSDADIQTLMQRAANLQRSGRTAHAAETLQTLIQGAPDHYPALCALASLCASNGQLDVALHYATHASRVNPEGFESLALIAQLQQQRGDFAAAREAMEAAARIQTDNDRIHFNLGVLSEQLGDTAAAMTAYRRAVSLNGDNLDACANLAMLELAANEEDNAIRLFAKVNAAKRGTASMLESGATPPNLPDAEGLSSRFKMKMDLEQLVWLHDQNKLPDYASELPDALRQALADLGDDEPDQDAFRRQHPRHHWKTHWQLVNRLHNRPIVVPDGDRPDGPLINPNLDSAAISEAYFSSTPNHVVVDDFLTDSALDALRQFCQTATIWHDLRRNYLGAYLADGFATPLTLGIAYALRRALPEIFGAHALTQAWGYKYGAAVNGIGMHADAAAVNCNFWITDDAANRNADNGGLLIYKKAAPLEWDFNTFNNDAEAMRRFLGEDINDPIRIPHRANRIVIFNSNLFHRTDDIHFKDDFLSRRYNMTLLYGRRERPER
ncbi:MAG: tetratricopeptide repeat protein [Pseudomonadota bacterium]